MKRRIGIGCVLFTALLIASCLIYSRTQNRLEVANKSGQTISELTITVGDETICFVNVAPDGVVTSKFLIRSDDHFVVRGKLADNAAISAECGYVTHGMWGERVRFTIVPDGNVEFNQGQYEA